MNVPNSIYGGDERQCSIYSSTISITAPSEIEFDFDDKFAKSRVYRRMLSQAMTKMMASDVEAIEGDLIDVSDVTSAAVRLFEGLVVSQGQAKVLGKEHVDTLDSIYWLARTLHNQQKYTEAEGLFRESVQRQNERNKSMPTLSNMR
jgi:hypothetical protein